MSTASSDLVEIELFGLSNNLWHPVDSNHSLMNFTDDFSNREQFGIKSCVLNHELPLASRLHIVEEFNKNIYNILIASDETEIMGSITKNSESRPKKKAKKEDGKSDSGVSRGK